MYKKNLTFYYIDLFFVSSRTVAIVLSLSVNRICRKKVIYSVFNSTKIESVQYTYIYIYTTVSRNVISKGGHLAESRLILYWGLTFGFAPFAQKTDTTGAEEGGKIAHALRFHGCSYSCTKYMQGYRYVYMKYTRENKWYVTTLRKASCLVSLRSHTTQINVSRSVGITGGCVRVRWMKLLREGCHACMTLNTLRRRVSFIISSTWILYKIKYVYYINSKNYRINIWI